MKRRLVTYLPTRTPHATICFLERVIFDYNTQLETSPVPCPRARLTATNRHFSFTFQPCNPDAQARGPFRGSDDAPPHTEKQKQHKKQNFQKRGTKTKKTSYPDPGCVTPNQICLPRSWLGRPKAGGLAGKRERWKESEVPSRSEPQETAKNGPTKDK